MKIATYNIAGHRIQKLERIAEVIERSAADVVMLQEVAASDNGKQLKELAGHAGYQYSCLSDIRTIASSKGKTYFGALGIISKKELSGIHTIWLDEIPGDKHRRMILQASFGDLTILNTHLSYPEEWNVKQLSNLRERIGQIQGTYILGGDFNCNKATVEEVLGADLEQSGDLISTPTYKDRIIDHLISNNLDIMDAEVIVSSASDHNLVSVKVAGLL